MDVPTVDSIDSCILLVNTVLCLTQLFYKLKQQYSLYGEILQSDCMLFYHAVYTPFPAPCPNSIPNETVIPWSVGVREKVTWRPVRERLNNNIYFGTKHVNKAQRRSISFFLQKKYH